MTRPMTLSASLQQGVLRELSDTFRQAAPDFEDFYKLVFRDLNDNNIRNARYGVKDSLPMPRYWAYNENMPSETISDRFTDVPIHNYGLDINANMFDVEDDQMQDAREHMQHVVVRYLELPSEFMAEYLNGTADFLPSLNSCIDGAALFNATDGDGNPRHGRTGGNIVTQTGITLEAIQNDLFRCQQAFEEFLDLKNRLFFSPTDIDFKNIHVFHPATLNRQFYDITKGDNLRVDGSANTAVSNTLRGTFQAHSFAKLTDPKDYFVMLEHKIYKPLLKRQQNIVEAYQYNMSNSDKARAKGLEGFASFSRSGAGGYASWVIIKVAG